MSPRARVALALLAAAVAGRGSARAQEPEAPVRLEIDPCVPANPARVGEMVALELRALASPPAVAAERPHVRVTCEGRVVRIARLEGARVAGERRLDLAAYPPAGRPRLLAMEISELLVPSAPAREDEPPAAAPAADVHAAAPPPGEAPPAARAFSLSLLGLVEHGGRPRQSMPGGALLAGWGVRPWLTLAADLRATRGHFPSTLGRVEAQALSLSAAPLVGRRLASGASVAVGPGLRVLGTRLAGRPGAEAGVPGRVHRGWSWGPHLAVAARVGLWSRLVLVAHGEAGWLARPVVGRVNEAEEVAVQGVRLGLGLGLGWAIR